MSGAILSSSAAQRALRTRACAYVHARSTRVGGGRVRGSERSTVDQCACARAGVPDGEKKSAVNAAWDTAGHRGTKYVLETPWIP